MAAPYRTLSGETRYEIPKIKGSRFIATAGPFRGEDQLTTRIEALRTEFPSANHHCHAWRRGERFRYSDDGEPSGTAGRPILQRIDGLELDRVQVVVTRIFGGSKLGTGGLVRAYSAAAGEALARAPVHEVIPTRAVTVTVPYALDGTLKAVVVAHGLATRDSAFGESVKLRIDVPVDAVDAFIADLRERTAGKATIVTEDLETTL